MRISLTHEQKYYANNFNGVIFHTDCYYNVGPVRLLKVPLSIYNNTTVKFVYF